MKLKRLEMTGFKSFADRTVFDFGDGMTAFVGPNGCGKSNVVDAVKWVLGEQSAKSLRGTGMLDVIFSGAAGRKPTGYAEVSLTLENNKKLLPVEYHEVCITRRLFRSGESEYLINRQPARLKDIRGLFMGTGVGMNAYSFMEQGKVDILLQSNSHDRRLIFEEAAGISKYKVRKRAAEARLERVETNLLRVDDILSEVEKRMVSIKRQAAKARRFRTHTDELKSLRVRLSSDEFFDLKEKLETTRLSLQDTEAAASGEHARLKETEAKISACETEILEHEHTLAEIRSRLAVIASQDEADAQQIEQNQKWLEQMEETATTLRDDEATCCTQSAELENEKQAVSKEIEAVQTRCDMATGIFDSLSSQTQTLTQELQEDEVRIDGLQASLMDAISQEKQSSNWQATLEAETRGLRGQRESRLEENSRIEQGLQVIQKNRVDLDNNLKEIEVECDRMKTALVRTEEDAKALDHEIQHSRMYCDDMGNLISRKEIDLGTLRALEQNREGLSQGVTALLDAAKDNTEGLPSIYGITGQLLRVPMDRVSAIEAALDTDVQAVVVESPADAATAVAYLRANKLGQATVLPRQCPLEAPLAEVPMDVVGVLGRASDLIDCDSDMQPLYQWLLGRVLVVENKAAMETVNRLYPGVWRIVTLAGDVFFKSGGVRGGGGFESKGIISRRAEMEQLESELVGLNQQQQAALDVVEKQALKHREILAQEKDQRIAIYEISTRITDIQKDLHHNQGEYNRLREQETRAHQELATIAAELERCAQAQEELRKTLEQCQHKIATLQREINMNEKATAARRERLETVRSESLEAKVQIAEYRKRVEGLREKEATLTTRIRECSSRLAQITAELASHATRRTQAEQKIQDARDHTEKRRILAGELTTEQAVKSTRSEEIRQDLRVQEDAVAGLRKTLEASDDAIHNLRLEQQEHKIKMQNLMQRISEDYALDLNEVEIGEERSSTEERQAWRERIDELRLRIDRMGNVNLNAIDEMESLQAEYDSLKAQEEDVIKAKESMHKVIGEINRTSRELFDQMFERIREHFQDMFRKFFGGGKADVFLTEGEDSLEAGIEIIARPPGKEPQSISLLSGGERTLTAVAMLFAIYKANPSPFCFLDEVDAPLDDANVGRFVQIMQTFTENSQFIVITHNKQTMSVSDVMYGITQTQPGISKKISVKLQDNTEQVQEVA